MEKSTIVARQVRVLRIVLFALILGILFFGAYILFGATRREQSNHFVTWVFAFIGVVHVIVSLVVPLLVERSAIRRILAGTWQPPTPIGPTPSTDEEKLALVFTRSTLVRASILEGGAFLNLFGCLLTGHVVNWAMCGFLLVLLLMCFPSYRSVANWIDAKLVLLKEERQLSAVR